MTIIFIIVIIIMNYSSLSSSAVLIFENICNLFRKNVLRLQQPFGFRNTDDPAVNKHNIIVILSDEWTYAKS